GRLPARVGRQCAEPACCRRRKNSLVRQDGQIIRKPKIQFTRFRDAGWPMLKRHVGAVVATAANPVMVGQPFDRRKAGLAGGSSVLLPRTVHKARVPGRPAFVSTRLPAWMPL